MHGTGPSPATASRRSGSDRVAGGPGVLRRHWPAIRKLLLLAFLAVVATLLFRYARTVDWAHVVDALRGYRASTLALAATLAAASYLLYGSFELLARRYTGHRLGRLRTLVVAMTSYAFNLNLGALVGGAGFRLRLYSKLGLEQSAIARIFAFSVSTNWLGYMTVAAVAFTFSRLPLPDDWWLAGSTLQAIGIAAGLAVLGWLLMCGLSKRREVELRGHRIELPSLRIALLQSCLAGANWLTIGAVIHVLLRGEIDYPTVLTVTMVAAIAGAATHVPAGLGVLEAVFLAVLGEEVGQGRLLAALLAYRAIYYIGPLLLAVAAYLALEAGTRRADGARSALR